MKHNFLITVLIVISSSVYAQCEESTAKKLAYTVRNSEVWCAQLKGVDLRKEFHTQHISYDDAAIRADFVSKFRQAFLRQSFHELFHKTTSLEGPAEKEMTRNEMIAVWIDGDSLHLRNAFFLVEPTLNIDRFNDTVEHYKKKLAAYRDSKTAQGVGSSEYCVYGTLNSYFTSLVIEDAKRSVQISLYFHRKQAIEEQRRKTPRVVALYKAARAAANDDYSTAFREAQPAAKEGNAVAQYQLAFFYDNGLGVKKDKKAALEWYTKSAQQGYEPAQVNLATIFANGEGVPQSDTEAIKWYRAAAENGASDAQYAMGQFYMFGRGVKRDPTIATSWWQKAAEQGDAPALHNLGISYRDGIVVAKDQGKARELLLRAAKQGHPEAQHALGHMYLHGWGGAKDASEGARWVKEAAEQGHVEAQGLLAALFFKGEGVQKDVTAAYMWLSMEGSRSDADAKRARDSLSRLMSPEQIANAEKLAKEWKPKRFTQP